MKAFVVTHYGPDGLRAADIPTPPVGPRDVLVDVKAASVNPLDKMVRNGEFKQLLRYKRPFTLGHDVAGIITLGRRRRARIQGWRRDLRPAP
jgi:NADPH:quinone reductase-like Zn-dependent oxidoreductase